MTLTAGDERNSLQVCSSGKPGTETSARSCGTAFDPPARVPWHDGILSHSQWGIGAEVRVTLAKRGTIRVTLASRRCSASFVATLTCALAQAGREASVLQRQRVEVGIFSYVSGLLLAGCNGMAERRLSIRKMQAVPLRVTL